MYYLLRCVNVVELKECLRQDNSRLLLRLFYELYDTTYESCVSSNLSISSKKKY